MIALHWYDEVSLGEIAVKGYDFVALYDEDYNEIKRVINIYGDEWENISIEGGDWSEPSVIPTTEDFLRADVDFLTMENEDLVEQVEQARADIDFLLMMSDEDTFDDEEEPE